MNKVKELLEEIIKGEGAYSQDPLTHASNTIENMQRLAKEALAICDSSAEWPATAPTLAEYLQERFCDAFEDGRTKHDILTLIPKWLSDYAAQRPSSVEELPYLKPELERDSHSFLCNPPDAGQQATGLSEEQVIAETRAIIASGNCPKFYAAFVLLGAYDTLQRQLAMTTAEVERLKLRLLSAAGDDLCRLTQEEIKELSSGVVKIPPKEEFLASCERFHQQIAGEAGVLTGCLTLAQLIAENQQLQDQLTTVTDERDTARAAYEGAAEAAKDLRDQLAHRDAAAGEGLSEERRAMVEAARNGSHSVSRQDLVEVIDTLTADVKRLEEERDKANQHFFNEFERRKMTEERLAQRDAAAGEMRKVLDLLMDCIRHRILQTLANGHYLDELNESARNALASDAGRAAIERERALREQARKLADVVNLFLVGYSGFNQRSRTRWKELVRAVIGDDSAEVSAKRITVDASPSATPQEQ